MIESRGLDMSRSLIRVSLHHPKSRITLSLRHYVLKERHSRHCVTHSPPITIAKKCEKYG